MFKPVKKWENTLYLNIQVLLEIWVLDVLYNDNTRDTECCSSDKTKIYIKLNDTKKPVRFDFVSMDESEVSIKLCKLYYADEV